MVNSSCITKTKNTICSIWKPFHSGLKKVRQAVGWQDAKLFQFLVSLLILAAEDSNFSIVDTAFRISLFLESVLIPN